MKSNHTHIAIVLDRSGSMEDCAADTRGGFDTFIAEQKKAPGTASLTLAQFDSLYEVVHDFADIQSIPPLVFVPRGSTALLDAIGRTITATGARLAELPEDARPEHVIFVIITDGEENASREFNRDQILKMIAHQRDAYKWEFVFLGANQDVIQAGSAIGIHQQNSMTYDPQNVKAMYRSVAVNTASVRSGSSQTMSFSDQDRKDSAPKASGRYV